jgi:anti-anti-sigma factor
MNVSLISESALIEPYLVAVVVVEDELVRGSETQLLAELLPRIRKESLALDLSGVERIDAAGIAALIELYCAAGGAGTEFSVVAPSTHVRDMLRLVGLESILVADGQPRAATSARCVACPAA